MGRNPHYCYPFEKNLGKIGKKNCPKKLWETKKLGLGAIRILAKFGGRISGRCKTEIRIERTISSKKQNPAFEPKSVFKNDFPVWHDCPLTACVSGHMDQVIYLLKKVGEKLKIANLRRIRGFSVILETEFGIPEIVNFKLKITPGFWVLRILHGWLRIPADFPRGSSTEQR